MKKQIACMLACSLLLLCSCNRIDQQDDVNPVTDTSVQATETTEPILFQTQVHSDYGRFSSFENMMAEIPIVLRVKVKSVDPVTLVAGYSPEDFEKYDEHVADNPDIATDLLLSVRSPYTVEIQKIYQYDAAKDAFSVGDDIVVCGLGGNCRGYVVDHGFPILEQDKEYILFLTRNKHISNGEPPYTIYAPSQCAILIEDLGTNQGTCSDELYQNLTLEELETKIIQIAE